MKGTGRFFTALFCLLLRCQEGYCYDNYNNNDGGNYYAQELDVCENSVVEVTSVTVTCNSPYSFYYGSGAHRNSQVCSYGDKATMDVTFDVTGDLDSGDDIYVTMAIVQDGDILASTGSESLCDSYVGDWCTTTGSYSFTKKIKLATGDSNNATNFVPSIHMAFSTTANGGYNLGALNIDECDYSEDNPSYVNWKNVESTQMTTWERFLNSYTLLIGTCILIVGFAGSIWISSYREEDEAIFALGAGGCSDNNRETGLMS
jgi:hypothetical protein